MKKTILTYGLLSGLVAAALMVSTAIYYHNSMDLKNGELFGYAGILLSMLFVYFGVRSYRDKFSGGVLSFGKAFQVGIFITLISCAFYVVAWLVVYQTMMPDFLDKYIEHALTQLRQSGATEEEIRQQTAKMEEYKTMYQNPFLRAAITFLEPFPVGSLVTLVTSLILRKKPK
ncbi:MAG: DUF4199 domain-containing protein [Lewinellaceae bacterium]|nr:DUF4199 domain-containing protein [Lewinellaceae bacterium]